MAHLSTRNAVAMVAHAKKLGLPVTCEATPHHFAITDVELCHYDSNYKMKPPLREHGDVDAVIEGIVSGAIDAIATDHAPHPGSEKMQEFERCPFGIMGLETALGLSLDVLTQTGKITLRDWSRCSPRVRREFCVSIAARWPSARRRMSPSSVTTVEWTYDVNQSFSKSRNSPFHGHKFRGGPVATIVAGNIVWRRDP